MPSSNRLMPAAHSGFSLIEILVGMGIGMIAIMVIMQVYALFEGQKRATTGSADAQTNGSIALYSIKRDALMAGFGLPLFSTQNSPLFCDPSPTVDHDSNAATPSIGIFPVTITDGGSAPGASDSIAIRYGQTPMGGVPVSATVTGVSAAVTNNMGCQVGDIAIISRGTGCAVAKVTALPDTTHITLASAPAVTNGSLGCMGSWNEYLYLVNNNRLVQRPNTADTTKDVLMVADIVNIQAQYGISTIANQNQVTQWVNASGATWGTTASTPTVANRNRIKAVRIAVVARGSIEKTNVTTACSSTTTAAPTGLCAWPGTATSPAPTIDLSNDPEWRRYHYRVFETIVPLRNMIWSRNTL